MHPSTSFEARPRDVLALAWPILVSMASWSVMGLVDSVFVGQLGTTALAAVGLANSALYLTTALWIGSLGAVRVLVAQRTGAVDPEDARAVAWQGLWLALAAGSLSLALVPLGPALLLLVGASAPAVDAGAGYLAVRLANSGVVFLVFALQGWSQGRGDTRTPMRAVLAGNALNVVLDPMLIHGLGGFPALGVTGAAVATSVAWQIQLLWLGLAGFRSLGRPVAPASEALTRLLRVGLPIGLHHLLDVAAHALFSLMLVSVGEAHVAAHVVAVRVLMVSVLPGHAVGEATGVLVGQSLGAGRPERAREAWWSGTLVATALMSVCGALFVLAPRLLLLPFRAEPDVLDLGASVLAMAGFVQIFDAVAMVAVGALNGAGDTRFSMAAGLAATWVVKVPLAALGVVLGFGVVGAWAGIATEIVVLAAVATHRVRGPTWLATGAPVPAHR